MVLRASCLCDLRPVIGDLGVGHIHEPETTWRHQGIEHDDFDNDVLRRVASELMAFN
jgi:hypothetical protein